MSEDVADLKVGFDTTEVKAGIKTLDDLAAAGARAAAGTSKVGAATGDAAAEVGKYQASVVGAAKANSALAEDLIRASLGFAASSGAAGKAATGMWAAASATEAAGHAAVNTRASYEALVLVHELLQGRTSRLGGSLLIEAQALLGAGKSAAIVGAIMSPLGLTIAALTGGLITGAVAWEQYAASQQHLADISAGVGRTVGLTAQSLTEAATAGAAAAGISVGAAEEQALAYAQTGKIGAEAIGGLISITEEYARATGEKGAQAAKDLGAAFADPAKGAAELDGKLNFLTATELQHIETLAKSGDALGAQNELLKDLSARLDDVTPKVGGLAGAWQGVSTWAGNAWHNIGGAIDRLVNMPQQALDNARALMASTSLGGLPGLPVGLAPSPQALEASQQADDARAAALRANVKAASPIVSQYDLAGTQQLLGLQGQLAVVEKALASARQVDQGAVAGLTTAQQALTRAVQTYAAPAQKAHDIAVAQAQAAGATTPAQKAAAAAALVRAQAEGEVATAASVSQKAQDAATTATERASKAHDTHAQTLAREAASIIADTRASYEAAEAYLKSTSAGLAAEAQRKAITQAVKDGLSPAQEAAKIASEQALADAEAVEALAKKATATADQVRSQATYNTMVAAGVLTTARASDALQIENALRVDNERLSRLSGAAAATERAAIAKLTQALEDENAQRRVEQALQARNTSNDDIARLRLEATLLGATNTQRAIAIAQLQAEQRLTAAGFNRATASPLEAAAADAAISAARAQAQAQVDLDQKTADYNATLNKQLDLMTQIAAQAQVLGDSLSKAFGTAGDALSGLLTAQASYAAKLAQIDKDRTAAGLQYAKDSAAWNLVIQKADSDTALAKAQHDGEVLNSAKNLFGQQTAAYKALGLVQEVYYAEQFALQAKAILTDTVTTVEAIAKSGLRSAAYGAEAFAKTLASLPFPFNLAAGATVLAALAAVGVKLAGGGGGSSVDQNLAQDTQKATGAGTLLGSPQAQSDSITKAMTDAAKDQNELLGVNNQMLAALQKISDNIGGLDAAIAQQLSLAGGSFDASSLGLGTTKNHFLPGILGGLLGFLGTGTTTTKTLLDQGITFSPQTLAQLLAGVQDQTYQTVETKKKTSFLGITLASSDKTNDVTGAVSGDLNRQIQLVVGSLRDGIVTAATSLGVTGAQATLDAFNVSLGKLSLQGLDPQGIQSELTAAFSKLGDQMAGAVAPSIAKFQAAGEGLMGTLVRLANEYAVTDQIFAETGVTFSQTGIASLDARDGLVKLMGGLDSFTSAADAYVQDILTPAQQLAPVAKVVADQMGALGLSSITTKEQFADVVSGLDLTTASGQQLYARLLQLAPAFAKVADAATALAAQRLDLQISLLQAQGDALGATALQRQKELAALDASLQPLQRAIYAAQDLAAANDNLATAQQNLAQLQAQAADAAAQAQIKALQDVASAAQQTAQDLAQAAQAAAQQVQSATQALTDAYNAQAGALQNTISTMSGFVTGLKAFRQSLDVTAAGGGSLSQQYAAAKSQFGSTASAAKAGDATALGNLQNVSQTYLDAAKAIAPDLQSYERAVIAVKGAVDAAEGGAQHQVDNATKQLAALNKQVSGLIEVNKSVLSVKDAIEQLHKATAQAAAAQAKADAAQTAFMAATASAQAAQAAQQAVQAANQAAQLTQQLATAQTAVVAGSATSLYDSKGNAVDFHVGIPVSASFYNADGQAQRRAKALSGGYDDDAEFWGRFFQNNTDLAARYNQLVASGATHGPLSTTNTNGEQSWQWVRDLYKSGNFSDRALYAMGGFVAGPGTGTSDSINAGLSNGEYVVTASATSRWRPLLDMLNAGYAGGGSNDNSLVLELRALREEVAKLRAENQAGQVAIAQNTGALARYAKRNDGNGAPVRALDPTQPIEVRVVA